MDAGEVHAILDPVIAPAATKIIVDLAAAKLARHAS
jgi:hypothetical protein